MSLTTWATCVGLASLSAHEHTRSSAPHPYDAELLDDDDDDDDDDDTQIRLVCGQTYQVLIMHLTPSISLSFTERRVVGIRSRDS